ncbi:MAG: CDP-alcohol phosphatidyltransferase family protein [Phycisphaerae bacterium]
MEIKTAEEIAAEVAAERKSPTIQRRPVSLRGAVWVQALARFLAEKKVRPNTVSLFSIAFAGLGSALLITAGQGELHAAAAFLACVPIAVAGRGLCNLLDGLIAVEGGFKTRSGELFNDFPDRIADLLFYVCAGYAVRDIAWAPAIGWAAGALAVLTAYVRLLGGAMGAQQYFIGPMAKTHRMLVLALGTFGAAVELLARNSTYSLLVALIIIAVGSLLTALRRAVRIVEELER